MVEQTTVPECDERVARMEAIMAEHETPLLRYAARIAGSTAAEDIVQNVFIKLFRGWEKGTHPTASLKGWLYRATHNEAVDHIRRESRLRLLHEKEAEENPGAIGGNPGHDTVADRKALVLEHVRALHPREQQVIMLRMEQGLSYKEISNVTGRSEGNVGNILHHAVRKLSARLRPASGAAEEVRHAM